MATRQLNIRLRDDLDQAVRLEAARQGRRLRDVIEDLIRSAPWAADMGAPAPPIPGQTTLAAEAPGLTQLVEGMRETVNLQVHGCPECGEDITPDGACSGCGRRRGD